MSDWQYLQVRVSFVAFVAFAAAFAFAFAFVVVRELLPCCVCLFFSLCPSNYALSGRWAGGLVGGMSGDCIKINLTESICLIAN